MENRAERVVFLVIDPDVRTGKVIDFLDKIDNSIPDLFVVLLTPKNFEDYKNSPKDELDDSIVCDLEWSPRQLQEMNEK